VARRKDFLFQKEILSQLLGGYNTHLKGLLWIIYSNASYRRLGGFSTKDFWGNVGVHSLH
jgi:hypothetical protein